jgi:hypothetical protein
MFHNIQQSTYNEMQVLYILFLAMFIARAVLINGALKRKLPVLSVDVTSKRRKETMAKLTRRSIKRLKNSSSTVGSANGKEMSRNTSITSVHNRISMTAMLSAPLSKLRNNRKSLSLRKNNIRIKISCFVIQPS